MDGQGAEHEGLFLVDTGTTGTLVLSPAVSSGAWTYESAQANNLTIEWGINTLYGTAKTSKKPLLRELRMGGFALYDLPVLEFSQVPGWSPGTVMAGGRQWSVLGILGNDVLMRESFYLSLARREMGWTENPPFRGTQSWELVPTTEPTPIYRLRDAFGGAEESLFLVDTGSVTDVLAPAAIEDTARQTPRNWLRIAGADGTSVELHVLASPEAGRGEFLGTIVWPNWDFPTALRGLFYDLDTRAVTAVCQWGDGTPLVPGLEVGDTLVSLPPEGSDAVVWRKPDGTEVTTAVPRSPLFP